MQFRQAHEKLLVDAEPLHPGRPLESVWTELESRADCPFFLTWSWIGPWLEHLPREARPHLLRVRAGDRVVGLAIICARRVWRLGLLPRTCWLLHESGEREFDRLTIEYNGVLVDRDQEDAATMTALSWIIGRLGGGDELVLPGLGADMARLVRLAAEGGGTLPHARRTDSARRVDLDRVRRDHGAYARALGKNTRAAVMRSLRLYEGRGPVEFSVAGTVAEAQDFFLGLERLHEASWRARGRRGAFSSPWFRPFHRRVIEVGMERGTVRLCRVTAGGQPLGFLYNFVWRGEILNYQSGFAYEADNRLKPGLLCHYLAVSDALARGEQGYDFLAGQAGHKERLSNDVRPMTWITVGRDGLLRRSEVRLRRLRRALRGLVADPRRPGPSTA